MNDARRLVQDLADGVLQPALPRGPLRDQGEVGAVGVPVRPGDVLRDLSRCAAPERHAGERASAPRAVEETLLEEDRQLTLRRDGKDVRVRDAERPGFEAVRSHREQLGRLAVPRRAVDDRLSVRRETCPQKVPPAEGELAKRHLAGRDTFGRRLPAGHECKRERGSHPRAEENAARSPSGRSSAGAERGCRAARRLGQVQAAGGKVAGEIAGRVVAARRSLARHRSTIHRTGAGTFGALFSSGSGSSRMMAVSVSGAEAAWNGLVPVSIS